MSGETKHSTLNPVSDLNIIDYSGHISPVSEPLIISFNPISTFSICQLHKIQ